MPPLSLAFWRTPLSISSFGVAAPRAFGSLYCCCACSSRSGCWTAISLELIHPLFSGTAATFRAKHSCCCLLQARWFALFAFLYRCRLTCLSERCAPCSPESATTSAAYLHWTSSDSPPPALSYSSYGPTSASTSPTSPDSAPAGTSAASPGPVSAWPPSPPPFSALLSYSLSTLSNLLLSSDVWWRPSLCCLLFVLRLNLSLTTWVCAVLLHSSYCHWMSNSLLILIWLG